MKILFISPHLPAPETSQAGERLAFEIIRVLSKKHEIHLVVRVNDGQKGYAEPLKPYCKAVYPVFYKRPASKNPFTIFKVINSYYALAQTANVLAGRESFDRIHAQWTETGLFLKKKPGMDILAHDVITKPAERRYQNSTGIRRLINFAVYLTTKAVEWHIYTKFGKIFVLSDYDRDYLLSLKPSLDVTTLTYPAGLNLSGKFIEREEKSILFVGAMNRGPNVEAALYFCRAVLPLIRQKASGVKFYIAGSRPVPEVTALGAEDKNIIVTGFVEDIESYYKKASVFVAPMFIGGGIIVKILDALAAGTPVVTSSIGNEGIGAIPGIHLLSADNARAFADSVLSILQNASMRAKIGAAGQDFVKARFNLERMKKTLDNYYP